MGTTLPPRNSTEEAKLLQAKVGVDGCASALLSLPLPTGLKWNQHGLEARAGGKIWDNIAAVFLSC